MALRLGADTDLVEAVSLIHDIGHPPFGHAGEDELKLLLEPYGGFEANAQNLRILTKLESKSSHYEGLNLTRAVIDGQMKYKKAFQEDKRKFIYAADLETMDWACKEARTAVQGLDSGCQSFECEIMDWADEAAYPVHDLEDSLHAGYINRFAFYEKGPRIESAIVEVTEKFEGCNVSVSKIYDDLRNCLLVLQRRLA